MATKKTADLSSVLIAKGQAKPTLDDMASNVPLNFRVPGEFRRRFRMYAAAHDLKLNELLRLAFDEYEKNHP